MIGRFAVLAALAAAPAQAADPVGTYSVERTNPGNDGNYRGTVTVTRTGDTFRVVWVIDGARISGTGIGTEEFIAVSITSGQNAGLALLGADGQNWAGPWTATNSRQLGTERWSRR